MNIRNQLNEFEIYKIEMINEGIIINSINEKRIALDRLIEMMICGECEELLDEIRVYKDDKIILILKDDDIEKYGDEIFEDEDEEYIINNISRGGDLYDEVAREEFMKNNIVRKLE